MKRSVTFLPALVSLALLGSLVTGCAKHDHHTPNVEPSGAACGGAQPTSSPSDAASSLYRRTASGTLQAGQSRPLSSITPGPEKSPTLSAVVINSNPQGLCAQIEAGTSTSFSKIGDTPLKNTPPFSQTPTTYQIVPKNGNSPYSYVIDQTANGDKTFLYNQVADSSGNISLVTQSQSYAKRLKGARSKLNFGSMLKRKPATWIGKPAFSSTQLEVRYRTAALQQRGRSVQDLEREAGGQNGRNIGFVKGGLQTRIVDVAPGDTIAALGTRLKQNAEVFDTHPVGLRYASGSTPVFPNDTLFDDIDQWDMYHIETPYAWGYTEGLSTGITIGVIDTGADAQNVDLQTKLIYGESDVNGVHTVGLAASQDEDGHGTNVSGIASADTNNGEGVAGVGWLTPIAIYRIFPNPTQSNPTPGASTIDEAQAIYNAVGNQHVNVINLSLGSSENGGWDSVEHDAVEYAISQGVTVVAAAGNERTPGFNPGVDFPGAYDGVIAVGATSLNDTEDPCDPTCNPNPPTFEYVSSYSNVGPQLSIVAPGGDPNGQSDSDPLHWITGLYTTTPGYGEGSCSIGPSDPVCLALYAGTSQATPHVTGTVALMLAEAKKKGTTLTPAVIKQTLQTTADDISDPNEGFGRLNSYRALAAVAGDQVNVPVPTYQNFVAFAYDNGAGNGQNSQTVPHIIDVTYPAGVQVNQDGTFRIADLQNNTNKYRIAVWADLNGDGKVDAGDYFGYASTTCTPAATCSSATDITAYLITSNTFTLP